jgi:hypothetical protein|tara:strand:+ start:314 stop:535 length:222 start_codon:yes stop_codon:yes gene_type:complete
MRITLEFNTDNSAFDTDNSFHKMNIKEVQNILDHVKREVTSLIDTNYDYSNRINDSNGNMIGSLKIKSNKIGV